MNFRKESRENKLKQIKMIGKYVYLETENLYIHVENVWTPQYTDEPRYVLEGEMFKGETNSEVCDFLHWDRWNQLTLKQSQFKYQEITENEFKEKLKNLLSVLRENLG